MREWLAVRASAFARWLRKPPEPWECVVCNRTQFRARPKGVNTCEWCTPGQGAELPAGFR
jgi:hypothetical protein